MSEFPQYFDFTVSSIRKLQINAFQSFKLFEENSLKEYETGIALFPIDKQRKNNKLFRLAPILVKYRVDVLEKCLTKL